MPETAMDVDVIREAEARGREQQKLVSDVGQHERRLNRLNGSLDRFEERLSAVETKVDEAVGHVKTTEAVARALAARAASHWERWFALAGIAAVLLAAWLGKI